MKNHSEFSSMAGTFISIIIILISSAAVVAWWWFHNHFSKQKKKLPPSPPRFPIIGNLHQLGSFPHRNLRSLSNQYGDLMLLYLGSTPVLIVSSAIAAKEIMKTHDLIFSNRPHSTMADKLLYGSQDISTLPYGDQWRQLRTICVTQLLSNRRVQSFRRVREQETTRLVQKIISSAGENSCLVNLSEMFLELTNDVICRVALGKKYSDENGEMGKKFKKMLMEFGELLGVFYIGDYIPWLGWVNLFSGLDSKADKLAKEFDDFLEDVVQQHRINNYYYKNKKLVDDDDESVGPDFVDILLEIQGRNSLGFEVKQDMIKALILDMFAAGTDTTYTVMEWAMAELLKNPKIMQKLQTEIRKVAGREGKQEISEEDIEQMPYLKAVIKETLRLHPPVPLLIPRESSKDVNIMGYHISKGTHVIVNAWAIGRDPKSWGTHESEQFRPERFLKNNNNGVIDVRGLHFELIPFGAGRRGCPGITFGIAVNELVLGKLLHKIDFIAALLPDGMIKTDEDFDMTESSGLTVHRKLPILAMATPHSCS